MQLHIFFLQGPKLRIKWISTMFQVLSREFYTVWHGFKCIFRLIFLYFPICTLSKFLRLYFGRDEELYIIL